MGKTADAEQRRKKTRKRKTRTKEMLLRYPMKLIILL